MLKITLLSNGIDIAGISFPNNSLSFEIYNSTTINIYLVVSKRKIFSSYYLDFLNSSNQQYTSPQAVIDDLLLNNNQPTGSGGGGGTASSITFSPNGDISSTNVQNAIVEVRNDTDTKLSGKQDSLGFIPENSTNKGQANGYAPLDSSSLIPSQYLPSYVDDVLEFANLASFPGAGSVGKIYIAIDTGKEYRWSGSAYIAITNGFIASTDNVPEGSINFYTTNSRLASLNHAATNKTSLVDADELTGQDSANSFSLIRVTALNVYNYIKAKTDLVYQAILTATNFGSFLNGLSTKSSLVSTDKIAIMDSSGNLAKTITYSSFSSGLTPTFSAQTKNTSLMGPIIGSSAAPTFRSLSNFDFPDRNKYKAGFIGDVMAFGDSYTIGTQASPNESYIQKLAAYNNITINNNAVGGTGVWRSCKEHFTQSVGFPAYNSTIWLSGFNDLRRGGSSTATISKIKGCLRSAIVDKFLLSTTAASAANNTGGTWSNISGLGGKSENASLGSARQSSTSGDTLVYTSPASTNVVVGTFNTDGTTYNYGRFTVTIDGTLMATFDPNGRADLLNDGTYDNGRTQEALVFTGLGNFAHTVTITLLDSKTTVIDYFGTMDGPNYNASFFVGGIPHMTATGYAIAPSSGSDAAFDAADVAIQSVIDEFKDYQIVFCPMNNYFDPTIHIGADNIHPNNAGYTAIFRAFQAGILPTLFKINKIIGSPNGTANTYMYTSNSIFIIGLNRTVKSTSDVTTQAQAQLNITSSNGDSNFNFLTSPTNNTTPVSSLKITKDGNLEVGSTVTTSYLRLGIPTTNCAFFQDVQDAACFSINRNSNTGVFSNTGKSAATIVLRGPNTGGGSIEFYTSTGNNTGWTMAANINSAQQLFVGGNTSANSTIQVGGSLSLPYTSKTANYTLTASDYTVDCTANSFTITLPTAVGITGRIYIIKNSGAGTITMATTSSQTIDGSAPNPVLAAGVLRLQSTGSNWITI